jgi:glycosyltransferase involved in cell wall biosynthesis
MTQRFIVVTPVYEDMLAARQLFTELAAQFGQSVFVVAVDDGSVREPVEVSWLAGAGVAGLVITLARNVGHQRAIAVGICHVAEHFPDLPVVTMDSDGEDVPATVHALLAQMGSHADIVVAQRQARVETLQFKFFYVIYKRVFRLLSGRRINFGNFALYSPAAVQRLSRMAELWVHVAATVLCSRLRIHYEPIDRGPRYAGKSKMNFVSLVLHGFRGLMVFAEDVLVRVGMFCGITAFAAAFGSLAAIVLKFIGLSSPGWFSVIIGVFLLIMLQTGILTLTTLLLTGVMKASMNQPPDYRYFVKSINQTWA